jgi:16S rRNA (guanine966-N2)-methyltransferase
MRVTGGKYRSRIVKCPKGIIRPAMDRMRESMFAILGNIEGLSFLDLFSGSGIIGIEAASRGAAPLVLVEKDRKKTVVLKKNISIIEQDCKLFIRPAESFIRGSSTSFDIIFLDPPFNYPDKQKLLVLVAKSNLLNHSSRVLLHHPVQEEIGEVGEKLIIEKKKLYGQSELLFFSVN